MKTPEQIARRLTKAQRQIILWLSGEIYYSLGCGFEIAERLSVDRGSRPALVEIPKRKVHGYNVYRLNKLGVKVREQVALISQ